jgi:hypothetical protein
MASTSAGDKAGSGASRSAAQAGAASARKANASAVVRMIASSLVHGVVTGTDPRTVASIKITLKISKGVKFMHGSISAGIAVLAVGLTGAPLAAEEDVHAQAAIVAAQLGTVAKHLQLYPQMALDFTAVSGEHCLNTWKAGGTQMVHFAVDPSATREDVIEFVKADSFTSVGIDVTSLPRMPAKLGAMEPGKWYYLPADEPEPHHGANFPFPLLLRASDLQ